MLARDRDDSRPTPIEASFPPGRNCYELYNICLYGAGEVATPVSETVVMSEHPSYKVWPLQLSHAQRPTEYPKYFYSWSPTTGDGGAAAV